jgi:hypothetical protein
MTIRSSTRRLESALAAIDVVSVPDATEDSDPASSRVDLA